MTDPQPPLSLPYYGAPWSAGVARFFRKYATFAGRASRSEYWWWALTHALIGVALNLLAIPFGGDAHVQVSLFPGWAGPAVPVTGPAGVIALIVTLGLIVPNLALTWRRLHDTDRSGLWSLIAFVPLVGAIVLLVFFLSGPRESGRRYDQPFTPATNPPGGY